MVALPVAVWSGGGDIRRMAPLERLIRPTALPFGELLKLNRLFSMKVTAICVAIIHVYAAVTARG